MGRLKIEETNLNKAFASPEVSKMQQKSSLHQLETTKDRLLDNPVNNKLRFPDDNQEYVFNITDLEEIKIIGIADDSKVVKSCKHKSSKQYMAIKYILIPQSRVDADNAYSKRLKSLIREIENFRLLTLKKIPHILQFYGLAMYDGQALICTELMDISLKHLYLNFNQHEAIPEILIGAVVVSVLEALSAIKEMHIIHRNIKPENILLNRKGEVKLDDFGESRIMHDSLASTIAGTFWYHAPELFTIQESDTRSYDARSDVWSLGITILEVLNRKLPFEYREEKLPDNIILCENLISNFDSNEAIKKICEKWSYPDTVKEFIELCLQPVESRPKYVELMKSKLYKENKNNESRQVLIDLVTQYSITEEDRVVPNLTDENLNKLIFPGDCRKYNFNFDDFKYREVIGEGRNLVRSYFYKPKFQHIAVKHIPIKQGRNTNEEETAKLEKLKAELENFRQVSYSVDIVDFYGLAIYKDESWLCMEQMDFSLRHIYLTFHLVVKFLKSSVDVRGFYEKFPEHILACVAVSMVDALSFCQTKGILHRDIKPQNILANEQGHIKLCDFGESVTISGSSSGSLVGTIAYFSPERLKIEQFEDEKVDVWSLGITLAEITYGQLPIVDEQRRTIDNIILLQHYIRRIKPDELINRCFGDSYSDDTTNFVRSCLQPLQTRPSFNDLKYELFYNKHRDIQYRIGQMSAFLDELKHFLSKIEKGSENEEPGTSKSDHKIITEESETVSQYHILELCPICLSNLENDYFETSCNHKFHLTCFELWQNIEKSCPMCRFDLSEVKQETKEFLNLINAMNISLDQLNQLDDKEERLIDKRFAYLFSLLFSLAVDVGEWDLQECYKKQLFLLIEPLKQKLEDYLQRFEWFVEGAHGDGLEVESYDVCRTRSGIEIFMHMFSTDTTSDFFKNWKGEDGIIKRLDEQVEFWHENYYYIDLTQIPEALQTRRKSHWWWFY